MGVLRLTYIISFLLLCVLATKAQKAELLSQQNLSKWGVKPANYSGITHLGNNRYALVDDKSILDGFHLIYIYIDKSGRIDNIEPGEFIAAPSYDDNEAALRKKADCEDIIYVPQRNTVFITSEYNAQVSEYDLSGNPTGRFLQIPEHISKQHQNPNGGFEALAYDSIHQTFWLTTENSLLTDSLVANAQPMRIVRFDSNLTPQGEWAYLMDTPRLNKQVKYYAHGLSAMTVLPNGKLLVMERELSIPAKYIGGRCNINIYMVSPTDNMQINNIDNLGSMPPSSFLDKELVASFHTNIKIGSLNYANYEGMCLGPMLSDGRQTLLLINDSQAGAGNSFCRLKDYIKVILLTL